MGPLKAPSSSHSWPNQYPPEHQSIIDEWIEDDRRSTFIAGPFDPEQVKAVIGHVRASPVLLVQKLDEHGVVVKNRVVYNASHPRTSKLEPPPPIPSINSQINKADYPCLWMTAVETKHMINSLPPHARVAGWDMAWAFQQLGNAPSQRSLFCMVISGLLYVWLVGIFGLASICGIFGACCDLTCHALELEFPSMLFRHYVDDFVVVELAPPDSPLGLRSWDSILAAVRRFGWVIHPSKHFPWSRRFQYLGIVWDLDSKTATLAESNQNKFRKKLEAAYKDGALLSLKDIASLIGSCQHTCVLALNRRSKLNALYTLRNSYRFQVSNTLLPPSTFPPTPEPR
ncbi:unnamed protein product [Tilletia laevis]|uniref:Reverse transcriptase domain-containing protein n=1 Tax=Tilletia laevis TaxID=157183 RepID=A0A9N8QPW7_9BASI|nr:hypothetical protein CF335_g6216 [Tilletia laevis]CAD6944015.1 unnamed protein product [Tilletia laevis]CAD6947103.1 unnamed protein product [Tilletia controversa]CAD6956346.1 unnamed protein product [Tilletia caries]CAD6962130.1 unnamed protein product [Tilletia laevis]